MKNNIALAFYYTKQNRYSFNALLGALESEPYFENLQIYLLTSKQSLYSELKEIAKKHEKVIFGVSFFTTQLWDVEEILNSLKPIKNEYKNLLFIAGGAHPTGEPLKTLKMGFDVVVRGEAEETLIELLKAFDTDDDLNKVKGIAYFDENGNFNLNPLKNHVNLDNYAPFSLKHRRFGPIEITRGCPFCCYYCQTSYMFGAKVRHRSIEKICEYVEEMRRRNLKDIRFITPNAFSYGSDDGKTLNIAKLEELLKNIREIIKPDGRIFFGSFPSEVRPEHVTEETIDVLLRYADNKNLVIGAQSGSDRILELCHRGHTVEDVYQAIKLTSKAGFIPSVDFIFGLPGETEDDVKKTIKVMNDLAKMGAKIHAHTFMPLPQTPFSQAPAGKISKELRRIIGKLISNRVLYGSWKQQEELAKRTADYLKN
ncbi:TIGR04013 family B12-binding domain/radical SAM domain-containing protein [Thermodesulfovibrio hydrogeniphilus]